MSGQPGRSAGTSLLVVAGALKTRPSDGQMDSICDRCDAGDIGGNAGAVVPGETSMPTKEFARMNLTDHAGVRLTHGKPKVNGVEMHYAIGGAGEPVFLLHGVPKTMSYWRHLVPLLTPHYTVIAVDNRGSGGSQRPPDGYDTATMADDVAELATHLGFDQFRVAGEDWGAAIAYAVAAFHRPRVQQLVFQETLLPGLPAGPGLPGGERDARARRR
jgi:alpha-beta hydrolase superfamily lysophospholipase